MSEAELLGQSLVLFGTLFLMVVGLIFTVIPPIPGTLVIWGAALGYGLLLGWEKLGWLAFIVITFLMLLGIIGDALGGQFGAKMGGASCLAVALGTILGFVVGIIASFIGTPIAGCIAGMVGTLAGILLVERTRHQNWKGAIKATQGYLAGTTLGIMVKITAGLFMIGVFLLRVYWGG